MAFFRPPEGPQEPSRGPFLLKIDLFPNEGNPYRGFPSSGNGKMAFFRPPEGPQEPSGGLLSSKKEVPGVFLEHHPFLPCFLAYIWEEQFFLASSLWEDQVRFEDLRVYQRTVVLIASRRCKDVAIQRFLRGARRSLVFPEGGAEKICSSQMYARKHGRKGGCSWRNF